MNNGAFGENFPYSNFHDLNMDWIIKIAKDFLDQYTHIQDTITNGETALNNKTAESLAELEAKSTELEGLLQEWYDTHSDDIANQLATSLQSIITALNNAITTFNTEAEEKAQETIRTIPADYTSVAQGLTKLEDAVRMIPIESKEYSFVYPTKDPERSAIIFSDLDGNVVAEMDDRGVHTKNNSIEAYDLQDLNDTDLSIADKDGNVLITFINGRVGLKSLIGKKVSILGDSISTYSGFNPTGYLTQYPSGDVDSVTKTWWWKVIRNTGMKLLKNCSWAGSFVGGNSTGTAFAGCSSQRIADMKDGAVNPDIIIIYDGINDWILSRTLGNWNSTKEIPSEGNVNIFADAYALMVYKLMSAYPSAKIFCCTLPEETATSEHITDNTYPRLNQNGNTITDFNNVIKEIANCFGVGIIDLHKESGITFYNSSANTLDGLHPNKNGMDKISETVSNYIK